MYKKTLYILLATTALLNAANACDPTAPSADSTSVSAKLSGEIPVTIGLSAQERFDRTRRYIEANPDMTMITEVTGLKENFFTPDLQFIHNAIQKRSNAEALKRMIDDFTLIAEKKYLTTFAGYNYIGHHWAMILSHVEEEYVPEFLTFYNLQFDQKFSFYKERGIPYTGGNFQCNYISAPGILIPHISDTGEIPIILMNQGYGFFISNDLATSIDFFAVATNQSVNFDYLRNEKPSMSHYHDYEHLDRGGRLSCERSVDFFSKKIVYSSQCLRRTYNIALLREKNA